VRKRQKEKIRCMYKERKKNSLWKKIARGRSRSDGGSCWHQMQIYYTTMEKREKDSNLIGLRMENH